MALAASPIFPAFLKRKKTVPHYNTVKEDKFKFRQVKQYKFLLITNTNITNLKLKENLYMKATGIVRRIGGQKKDLGRFL